jgi:hypothetical protein
MLAREVAGASLAGNTGARRRLLRFERHAEATLGTGGPENPILIWLLVAVAASVVLAVVGLRLRKNGMLRTPVPALGWAVLTILPLFGAGFAMRAEHVEDEVTGETQAGKNADNVRSAPGPMGNAQ